MKNLKEKDRIKIADIENPENIDIEDILSGETVTIEIVDKRKTCPECGSNHIRNRMIDLPIINEVIALKKTKISYCTDCKTSTVEKSYIAELIRKLADSGIQISPENLTNLIDKGLAKFEENWKSMENERKVISIYFPSKDNAPQKAQISLSVSDPLYSKIYNLTSKQVRTLLGLDYFEELKRQAELQGRTVSQFLKNKLKEKLIISPRTIPERAVNSLLKVSEERKKYKPAKKAK